MHVQVEAVVLLHRVVREGLSEKMTFQQMPERHEGTSFEDIWVKSISRKWIARTKAQRQEHVYHVQVSEQKGSKCGWRE